MNCTYICPLLAREWLNEWMKNNNKIIILNPKLNCLDLDFVQAFNYGNEENYHHGNIRFWAPSFNCDLEIHLSAFRILKELDRYSFDEVCSWSNRWLCNRLNWEKIFVDKNIYDVFVGKIYQKLYSISKARPSSLISNVYLSGDYKNEMNALTMTYLKTAFG